MASRPDQRAVVWLDDEYAAKADLASALLVAGGHIPGPAKRVRAVRVAIDELLDKLKEEQARAG